MTIPALSLDDLTYEDLRQMAMRRIPAASGGRWTHHEPVDAGVTLIELFAFLLEQQLFVLDQVPDSLTNALLALLGEAPLGAGVARTLVAPITGTVSKAQVIRAGTELRPEAGGLDEMVFTTEAAALALPVIALDVLADGGLASDRLDRNVPVSVFEGPQSSLSVEATLQAPLTAGTAGAPLTLALILADTGVAAEWEEDAVDVDPATALALSWASDTGSGAVDAWEDGTGGLRRSGLIRLPLPEGAEGSARLRLMLTGDGTAFAQPPRLLRVAFGAMPAAHRRSVTLSEDTAGTPTHDALFRDLRTSVRALLPNSGQTLTLPAALSPALAASIRLALTDRNGAFQDWQAVPDLTAAAPEERAFTFDRLRGVLSFGDGYAGRPPGPADDLRLSLDVGGGAAGNHAAGMTWRGAGSVGAFVSLADATGGREAETPDEARARVAASLAERHRAVTAADYVALAETTPGIGPHRAHVTAGLDPSFPCLSIADSVTVFVVPKTGAAYPAPAADDGALAAIRARLDAARMLTTRVFVARPAIRPIAIVVGLAAGSGSAGAFAETLRPVLSRYLHPTLGGTSGDGWPFGGPLRPSELLRVAQDALGREARIERVALRLADVPGTTEEDCTELAIGQHDLVRLADLRVTLRDVARQEVSL